MKQSIVVVLLAVLVCSIAQPGFAADFTFKIAGVQIKKLDPEVRNVYLQCTLYQRTGGGNLTKKAERSVRLSRGTGSDVVSGPITMVFDTVQQKELITTWRCELLLEDSSGRSRVAHPCNPQEVSYGYVCIDSSQYNKALIQADITP